jgi:tetratricopeptide (TPR) repeat protein
VVVITVLLAGGAVLAGGVYLGQQRDLVQQERARAAALVARFQDHGPIAESLPGARLDLSRAVGTLIGRAMRDSASAAALKRLEAGSAVEAEAILRKSAPQIAANATAAQPRRDEIEAHFLLGTITALDDPARARDSFAKAAALDGTDRTSQFWHGWLELLAGNMAGAERAYGRVAAASKHSADGIAFWAAVGLGDIAARRQQGDPALRHYAAARHLAQQLVSADPSSIAFQRMWAAASDRLGGALIAAGKAEEALGPVRDSLAVATRLAEKGSSHSGRQRELALAHSRLGDVLAGTGKTKQALGVYAAGVAIARRLAESPGVLPVWRRDLAVALVKLGDAERRLGRLDAALKAYEDAHDAIVQAAASMPGARGWQEDLSVSNERIGDVRLERGEADAALASYQAKANVARELAAAAHGEKRHHRDLALGHRKIASALLALGRADEALTALAAAKAALATLGGAHELAQVSAQIGDVLKSRGPVAPALAAFKDAETVLARLLEQQPHRLDLQREVAAARDRIGDLSMQLGQLEDAMAALRSSLAARQRLAKLEPDNGPAAREVAVTLGKIGDVLVYQQRPAEALPTFRSQLEMSKRLADAEPDNAIRKHDVAIAWERIGRASYMTGDRAAARDGFERSLGIYEGLLESDGGNAHFLSGIAIPLVSLGSLDAERRQGYYTRAYRILRSLADAGRLEPRRQSLLSELERNLGRR